MKKGIMLFGIWLVMGIIFFIEGSNQLKAIPKKENRLEVIGKIADIEIEEHTDDTSYKIFVEYEIDGESYYEKLGFYIAGFKIGQDITLYYEEGKPNEVYSEKEEKFLKIFKNIGTVFIAFGLFGVTFVTCKEKGIF